MSAYEAHFEEGRPNRYDITLPKVCRLPPNPNIVGFPVPSDISPRLVRSYDSSATANAEPQEDKEAFKQLLKLDQMSFITGSASVELKACRIINPVRGRKSSAEEQEIVSDSSDTVIRADHYNSRSRS